MAKPRKYRIVVRGRDAGTGRFIPLKEAQRRKKTAIVDRMRVPVKKGK